MRDKRQTAESWPPGGWSPSLRAAAEAMADAVEDSVFAKDGHDQERLRSTWQRFVEVAQEVDDRSAHLDELVRHAEEHGLYEATANVCLCRFGSTCHICGTAPDPNACTCRPIRGGLDVDKHCPSHGWRS